MPQSDMQDKFRSTHTGAGCASLHIAEAGICTAVETFSAGQENPGDQRACHEVARKQQDARHYPWNLKGVDHTERSAGSSGMDASFC